MTGRFKKIEGLDYKRGAVEYAQKLEPSDLHHLYTKPFYNLANKISRWSGDGLDEDTQRHFIDFANMAYALALPADARILDVGCGSGWLCEYFSRLGYETTGLDLSPELIRIAKERLARVPFGLDGSKSLKCRFVVHDIEVAPLDETFDAVICYDALHHFEDESSVVRNMASMLRTGGQLFVAEGERPPEGSASEEELRQVMERYETLESPFSREYLLELLHNHGLAIVGDYTAITKFVDRDNVSGNSIKFVESPAFNYLLCKKLDGQIRDSRDPGLLQAKISLTGIWEETVSVGSRMLAEISVENTGDTLWLVSEAPLQGRVRMGLKILNEQNEIVSEIHGWPRLQRAIAPGESVMLRIDCAAPDVAGKFSLKVDLLDQDIAWFEDHGSQPLLLPFTVSTNS
jgi:SAM-dependent methyltransferase